MKNWIFCLTMAFFAANATAQDTTFTRISTEPGTLEQQQIETEADRLFGTKVPARWMVNVHASPYSNNIGNLNAGSFNFTYFLGAEFKLLPDFSTGLQYSYGQNSNASYGRSPKGNHSIMLEQRWYPGMARRIKEGKAASNFSGTYWGLKTGFLYLAEGDRSFKNDFVDVIFNNTYEKELISQIELRYGLQRRWRKNSFFDYSAGITVQRSRFSYNQRSSVQLNQHFRIGLALFEGNKNADYSGAYCGVLRCFEDNRRMFKVNTLNFLNVFYNIDITKNVGFALNPNIAFEQKLASSPFSIEAETDINMAKGALYNNWVTYRGYSLSGAGSLRWYYNQPKRIAAGRSGNNLSGPFVAVRVGYSFGNGWSSSSTGPEQKNTTQSQALHALWGYQLRIFKHGYAAFRIGLGDFNKTHTRSPSLQPETIGGPWRPNLFSDLKVGFAF